MRVSTRKLRSVYSVFRRSFPHPYEHVILKPIRKTAGVLGDGVDAAQTGDVIKILIIPSTYASNAEAITEALASNTFVFDGGDLMPPAVGQGTLWTGMVDHSRGVPAQEVADAIEASWDAVQDAAFYRMEVYDEAYERLHRFNVEAAEEPDAVTENHRSRKLPRGPRCRGGDLLQSGRASCRERV